jgi:predicted transcriptional regulator YdeE
MNADFRIIKKSSFTVVGVPQSSDASNGYGDLWQQFELIKGEIVNKAEENIGYGLQIYPPDGTNSDRFTYLACCEVTDLSVIPFRLFSTAVPEAEFAVFTVANWYGTSWKAWISAYEILDKSEYTRSRAFDFERYNVDEFTKEPEDQEIEIWVPVIRK